jgi:hypothetical protein
MNDLYFPPVARFRFAVTATTPIELPPYTGSMWRGALATAFRQSVCVPRVPSCAGCLITDFCAFFRFFEDGAPADQASARFQDTSRPYVLNLLEPGERTSQPGERLTVGLTLIGEGIDFLPYWIYAFQRAGELAATRQEIVHCALTRCRQRYWAAPAASLTTSRCSRARVAAT